jgi:hypothetical protein
MNNLIGQLLLWAACTAFAGFGLALWLAIPNAAGEFLFVSSAGFSGLVALLIHTVAKHWRGRSGVYPDKGGDLPSRERL